jgi:hypothetical protein
MTPTTPGLTAALVLARQSDLRELARRTPRRKHAGRRHRSAGPLTE